MKKGFSTAALAALSVLMLASGASAGPATTTNSSHSEVSLKSSADYKDLSNLDAGMKAKVDVLLSKGIFEGVSNDTFGIDQKMTRAQFAKVAALIFGINVDMNVTVSSFQDVWSDDPANGWAIPYIEAAKKAGLIDGMTDTTFAPGEQVTIGQMDTVLVKGLGGKVDVSANPWYANAVGAAAKLGIHPEGKDGGAIATRADLVEGAYGGYQANQAQNKPAPVSVISVTSAGEQKVVVKFDGVVDTSKAILTLTKGNTAINTTTTWSEDKKSAALTLTDTALTAGDYTVTLSGMDASAIKTATGTLNIPEMNSTGVSSYTVTNSLTIANVIDSGLTDSATGTNGFATKADAQNPAVSKFAKEIKFNATTASGDPIALSGIVQSITSSDPTVAKVAVSADNRGYVLGNKAGTATVNVVYKTLKGESKQISLPVTVVNEPIAANQIEIDNSRISRDMTVTGNVYATIFDAYTEMGMKVYDNFGNMYDLDEIKNYNFALGVFFIAEHITGDPKDGAVGTVTINPDGTVLVTGNVTTFDLAAILPNGKKVYTQVDLYKS